MLSSPFITKSTSVSVIMFKVLLALVPGIALYVWYYGPAILVSLALASVTALATEAAMLKLRNRPIKPFLSDNSALLTAWLLALSVPPLAPWWLVVVGTLFAISIAKHLYGGLGNNPFSPTGIPDPVLRGSHGYQAINRLHREGRLNARVRFSFSCFGSIIGMPCVQENTVNAVSGIGDDLLRRHSRCEVLEDIVYGDPQPSNAGLATALPRLDRDDRRRKRKRKKQSQMQRKRKRTKRKRKSPKQRRRQ